MPIGKIVIKCLGKRKKTSYQLEIFTFRTTGEHLSVKLGDQNLLSDFNLQLVNIELNVKDFKWNIYDVAGYPEQELGFFYPKKPLHFREF